MWYQCKNCVFATNSTHAAEQHEAKTGHETTQEEDN